MGGGGYYLLEYFIISGKKLYIIEHPCQHPCHYLMHTHTHTLSLSHTHKTSREGQEGVASLGAEVYVFFNVSFIFEGKNTFFSLL